MAIIISLQDRSVSPPRIILDVQSWTDDSAENHWIDHDSESAPVSEQEFLARFVQQVQSLLPIKDANLTVYLGWWGDQATFNFPPEFIQLLAEHHWSFIFDIND